MKTNEVANFVSKMGNAVMGPIIGFICHVAVGIAVGAILAFTVKALLSGMGAHRNNAGHLAVGVFVACVLVSLWMFWKTLLGSVG